MNIWDTNPDLTAGHNLMHSLESDNYHTGSLLCRKNAFSTVYRQSFPDSNLDVIHP